MQLMSFISALQHVAVYSLISVVTQLVSFISALQHVAVYSLISVVTLSHNSRVSYQPCNTLLPGSVSSASELQLDAQLFTLLKSSSP